MQTCNWSQFANLTFHSKTQPIRLESRLWMRRAQQQKYPYTPKADSGSWLTGRHIFDPKDSGIFHKKVLQKNLPEDSPDFRVQNQNISKLEIKL